VTIVTMAGRMGKALIERQLSEPNGLPAATVPVFTRGIIK